MYLTDSLENIKGLIFKYVKETLRTIILPLIYYVNQEFNRQ